MLDEMTARLRVGLLLESFEVPAWAWTAIRELTTSGSARVVAVAIDSGARQQKSGAGRGAAGRTPVRRALRRIDELLERRIPADQDAFIMKDARPLLTDVPVMHLRASDGASANTFAEADLAGLRRHNLDVLLRCGEGELRGGILHVARAGAWSLHEGDNRKRRGGPPGFWEVHQGWPVMGAALELLDDGPDRNLTLATTSSAPVPTAVKRTRNGLIWTALPLLGRTLDDLRREGVDRFLERVAQNNASPTFYSNPLYREPGPMDLAVHGARRALRLASFVVRTAFTRQQWILYYGLADDLIQA